MDAVLPFILPIVCLVWCLAGLTGIVRAKPVYLRQRARSPDVAGGDRSEVGLSAMAASADTQLAERELARGILVTRLKAGFWFVLGLVGVWGSGLTAGLSRDGVVASAAQESEVLQSLVLTHVAEAQVTKRTVGLVIAAVADNQEVIVGVGQVAVRDSSPPNGDTVYEIGSISKPFTGILLAEAIESGTLKPETQVQSLLPDGVTLPARIRDDLTLMHLATHSSGFPRLPANFTTAANLLQIAYGGDPHRRYDLAQFHEAVGTVEHEFSPGSQTSYSNFGASLLGYLLSLRANQSYETLLRQRIARPLGMNSTVVHLTDELRARLAVGYRSVLGAGGLQLALRSANWDMPDHYAGAGGIRSTAKDMLRFLKANMGRPETAVTRAIQRSHVSVMDMGASGAVGMHWLRDRRGEGRPDILWHNGGTGGYRTYLGFTQDGRFGVVVMASTAVSMDALGVGLLEQLEQTFDVRHGQ